MPEEFDPESILEELKSQPIGGVRKMCTDHKRCGLGNICEFAQSRNEAVELLSLWDGKTDGCHNYNPRREICDERHIFRSKSPRHNKLNRKNLLNLKAPDLMVRRHIKDGRNIKEDN